MLKFLQNINKVSTSSETMMAYSQRFQPFKKKSRPLSGLHVAAYFDLLWPLEALLKNGHDPNTTDCQGRTPLSWAAEIGHNMIVDRILVEAGVDDDAKGKIFSWRNAMRDVLLDGVSPTATGITVERPMC